MMNRVGFNAQQVRNAPKQSVGFGNGENPSMQKIADLSNATEEKLLKPAAALAAVVVGGTVGHKGGGRLTSALSPMLKTVSEGFSKAVIPFIQKHADSTNIIGKGLKKLPSLVNLAKSGTPLETIAERLAAPVQGAIKGFTALAAAVYVGKKAPQMENAIENLVDTVAVTGATGT